MGDGLIHKTPARAEDDARRDVVGVDGQAGTQQLERAGHVAILAVDLGHTSVGEVIFVDYFLAQPIKPLAWDRGDITVMQLGRLADPRGAVKIVEAWKATIDLAAKHEKRKNRTQIMAWSGWRKDAAKALGQCGELAAKEFLVEQMALTKDRYLKKECVAAIALIDARLAAKSTAVSPPLKDPPTAPTVPVLPH